MQKPSFGVVTSVVVVLTAIAFFSKPLIGQIPEGPENRLATENAEFLQQAAHEQIDWRTLSEETFADARKQDKPIMLVVGSACSPTGRVADRAVLPAKEIRGFLARNFICARIDAMARPEFANAFLPISRAVLQKNGRLAIPPDYQIWFLDPKGYLFDYAAETNQDQPLDARVLLADLEGAVALFAKLQDGSGKAGGDQRRDIEVVETAMPPQLPDLAAYASFLATASPPDIGGFPSNGFQRLWPEAWRYQLLSKHYLDYSNSIAPLLMSPQVDLLDGGFYTTVNSLNWRNFGYDKLAVVNASMMDTLALGSVVMHDDVQRWLALETFDCLLNRFDQNGFLAAGQIGDEGDKSRSTRSSFSPRRLRDLFPDESDREWLRNNFGLRVETNPQMTPMMVRLDIRSKDAARFDSFLDVLRKDRPEAKFAGIGQLDVGGFATARMMEAARLMGDKQRLLNAEGLFERLDDFRSLNDVVHSNVPGAHPTVYLGDYLAYADGALQYFLATGNPVVFNNGLAVLRRGLFLYAGKVKGEYWLSQPTNSPLAPQDASSVEIVDNIRESCSAQIIRLCHDYGRLLGTQGADLQQAASDTLTRFAPISPGLGQFAAGYFCAASQIQDSTYAVTVGPDASSLANLLAQAAPTRLIAPALGPVRAPNSQPGIYVIHNVEIRGPLSLEKAAKALQPAPF